MNVYEETQLILHKYKIQANKSLGQNFLVDDNVIDEIIRCSNIDKKDLIIEIGPGLGVLTNRLLQESNNVMAVELDKRMVSILQDRFKLNINGQTESKLEIINEDILKINLNQLIAEKKSKNEIKQVKIVANLPYYISTPIIMKLLEEKLNIESITVMIQKEVAQRLAARPGEKEVGSITYTIWYYTEPKIVLEVPRDSFIPEPEVTSSVINLKVLDKPRIEVEDEKIIDIIAKEVKTKKDALKDFEKAERQDLIDLTNREIEILQEYLTSNKIDVSKLKICTYVLKKEGENYVIKSIEK